MNKGVSFSTQRTVTKVDLRKQLGHLYNPSAKEAVVVDVPEMPFLMVDGVGNPNTAQEYQEAIEALYGVAYALKFLLKKEQAVDYPVMPLEGLWWAQNMRDFSVDNKEIWQWTMMIMQPEEVTADLFERALAQVKHKKDSPALPKMRLERFHEGLAARNSRLEVTEHLREWGWGGTWMGVTRCARATISAGVQDIGVKYASTPLSATLSACWETRPATIRARSPACLFQHQPKKAVRQTSLGSTSAEETGSLFQAAMPSEVLYNYLINTVKPLRKTANRVE